MESRYRPRVHPYEEEPVAEDKKGTHRPNTPEKKNHAMNFDKAIEDALRGWSPADGTEVTIAFEASVTPNPGGIREYRVVFKS
jgi:hypothetical protein